MAERIGVLGAGSWGTALAISLAEAGRDVTLWARKPEAAERMARERHNPVYLPDAVIPPAVVITADLALAARERAFWVVATPSHAVRELAGALRPYRHDGLIVVSLAKGIENNTLLRMTQVLEEVLELPGEQIGVLHGPSHAEEVVLGRPTTIVAASSSVETAHRIQEVFMNGNLRVYVNRDVIGVEIGGAVKNVLALAAGISDGVGYGDNAKAALVTRGIAEMQRLGMAMGADPATFSGLTGIGDLVVTCMSRHSRNRYFGEQLGLGKSREQVEAEMSMVAEGVRSTQSVYQLSQRMGIEMPITEAVYGILFESKTPEEAVNELMSRSAKREDWLPDVLPADES